MEFKIEFVDMCSIVDWILVLWRLLRQICMEILYTLLGVLEAVRQVLVYFRDWYHYYKLVKRFPGPPGLPIVGNLFDKGFKLPDLTYFHYLAKDCVINYCNGQIRIGPIRFLFLSDPEDIECYMRKDENQNKPRLIYSMLGDVMGDGLVTLNGKKWKFHHKTLLSTLRQSRLNSFLPVLNRETDVLLKILSEKINEQQEVDIEPLMKRLSYDAIMGTLIGAPSSEQHNVDSKKMKYIDKALEATGYRILYPWLFPPSIFFNFSSLGRAFGKMRKEFKEELNELLERRLQILTEKLKNNAECSPIGQDLWIDALLRQKLKGLPITNEEIQEEAITGLSAGFDASYLTTTFALYELAKNNEIQEKVMAELRGIFGTSTTHEVTPDKLQRMTYTEMVIKETLRLYPAIWFFVRETGVDTPLVSSDLVVPKGAMVVFSAVGMHRRPQLYPEPQVFNPERFSPEGSAGRHPFAFIPFGAGQRVCIGKKYGYMVIKTYLSKILMKYEVKVNPNFIPSLKWGISTMLENGMHLQFHERQHV